MDLLPCCSLSILLLTGTQRALAMLESGAKNGSASIHICKFAVRACRNRFFWLGYRLLHLGWSGLVWFSDEQSRCQPDAGHMGFLDAGVHAVPHRPLSADWTDLVQRVRQSGSLYTWRAWPSQLTSFTGSRCPTGDISIPAPSRTAGWPSHSCFSAFLEWTFFGVPETSP